MPRACTICTHPDRQAVEQALSSAVPLRSIAERYAVSKTSLLRHQRHVEADHGPDQDPTTPKVAATSLVRVACLGCEAVKACPVGELWICARCAKDGTWQRVAPTQREVPTWRYHPVHPARIVETFEALDALEASDSAWRDVPYTPLP